MALPGADATGQRIANEDELWVTSWLQMRRWFPWTGLLADRVPVARRRPRELASCEPCTLPECVERGIAFNCRPDDGAT